MSETEYRLVHTANAALLDRVAAGVFDGPILADSVRDFLADPRHHLIVALAEGTVVGIVSALDYVHADTLRAMFVNELGVDEAFRRQGIARRSWTRCCSPRAPSAASRRGLPRKRTMRSRGRSTSPGSAIGPGRS